MIDWSQPVEFEDGTPVHVVSIYEYQEKSRAFVKVPYSIKGKIGEGTWAYTEEGYFQGAGEPTSGRFSAYLRIRNVDELDLYKEDLT